MAFDFPASPSIDQDYVAGTVTYTYNGTGWVLKGTSAGQFVSKSGDTMTGNLTITKSGPQIILNKTAAGSPRGEILGQIAGSNRWALVMPSGGEDFAICRYDDTGTQIDVPFNIVRLTGQTNLPVTTASTSPTTGALTVVGGVGIGLDLFVGRHGSFGGHVETNNTLGGPSFSAYASSTREVTMSYYQGGVMHFTTGMKSGEGEWKVFAGTSADPAVFRISANGSARVYNDLAVSGTSPTTSVTTGALTVAGGVGIIGGAFFGSDIALGNNASMVGTLTINNGSGVNWKENVSGISRPVLSVYLNDLYLDNRFTGTFYFRGGTPAGSVNILMSLDPVGNLKVSATSASTSRTTGALVVSGGVGVSGNIFMTGEVNIRQGSDAYPISSGAGINIAFGTVGISTRGQNDSGTWHHKFVNISDTVVGNITTTATTTSYNTTSDERLKDDFKSFDAGKIIDQIEVFDFKWKTTQERDFGVIAQRVARVHPLAVNHLFDTWSIDYSKFVPLLLQEVKSLRNRLNQLEDK